MRAASLGLGLAAGAVYIAVKDEISTSRAKSI